MLETELELIDLDIPELGYFKFLSSWLYHGPEGNFLVDVGPSCTLPLLFKALDANGIDTLDWVLLTHIHQDHAGGLGELVSHYPEVKILCHEKGVHHLVDPAKLWEGSIAVLGKVAEVYGPILPIPAENIHVMEKIPFGDGIKVIPTPGHASHHQCYVFKDRFFAGELFGAFVSLNSGIYLRPATPHRFIFEEYLKSLDLVEQYLTDKICFAHYGQSGNSTQILRTARNQLQKWVRIIAENGNKTDFDEIIGVLLEQDEIYSKFNDFDKNLKAREHEFSINSIRGILRYLESR
jgi:glyoxylase-like metal-dependent hydrolase (beta-lactamase superfamily II)